MGKKHFQESQKQFSDSKLMTKIISLLYLSKFTWLLIRIVNCLDSVFPFDILEEHVFAQSSKYWSGYLRAFLHQYTTKIFSTNTPLNKKTNHFSYKDKLLIEKLAFLSKMSLVFLKKSKGIVIYVGFKGHRNMAKYKSLTNVERIQEGNHFCHPKFKPEKFEPWIDICILSSPTKNVLSETAESTHFDNSIGFVLDPLLQLNITFLLFNWTRKGAL